MRLGLRSEKNEGLLAAAIILVVVGIVYCGNLGSWLINDDEGSFLYQVWRMAEGEQPYSDFLSSRDPLFLYTGAAWMRLWGPNVVPMRALSAVATLVTGFLVYLLASQMASRKTALVSMLAFLLHPHVVNYGRMFQPEPFFLLFVVLGLCLVELGLRDDNRTVFALAGASFAVATLYKLLAALSLGGCMLYFAVLAIRKAKPLPQIFLNGLSVIVSYALVFGITVVSFAVFVPGFVEGVIDVNLVQGSDLALGQVLLHGVFFFMLYAMEFVALLLASVPALVEAWSGKRQAFVAWQLPSALAFMFLSRALFPRLLFYLIPSFVILMAVSAAALWSSDKGRLYHFVFIGMVLIPWLVTDAQLLSRSETDTLTVARYIASHTEPGDRVLSDYQEINFYAQRASTYHGAEISYVIVDGGTLTADIVIREMEAEAVEIAIIDTSPHTAHQLVVLSDYADFVAYLSESYELVQTLDRVDQFLMVYRRVASTIPD